MIFATIPDKYFEIAGTFFGFLASATIGAQVIKEFSTDTPSTMSPLYVVGFLVIFVFWTLYGIRFNRMALWLTNGVAVVMQSLLVIITFLK